MNAANSPANTEHEGARWVRAALQVNPFDYEGQSAPSTTFPNEAAYNAAILDRCQDLGIEIIGITDHWRVDPAGGLIADADARGITALPGFEANSAEGYHLQFLLEAGTDLGRVNAAIGACGVSPGSPNGTTGKSFADILAELAPFDALVIPAHANVPNAGMLTGRRGSPLEKAIRHPALHALATSLREPAAKDQQDIVANRKPVNRPHPLAIIYSDDICHPDKLAEIGSSSWFKVSKPCLSSLMHAVRTPETRVALANPESQAPPRCPCAAGAPTSLGCRAGSRAGVSRRRRARSRVCNPADLPSGRVLTWSSRSSGFAAVVSVIECPVYARGLGQDPCRQDNDGPPIRGDPTGIRYRGTENGAVIGRVPTSFPPSNRRGRAFREPPERGPPPQHVITANSQNAVLERCCTR